MALPATGPVFTITKPINLLLLPIFVLCAYYRLRPRPKIMREKEPSPPAFQTFTPPTLLPNNGENGKPVYLAVRGKVFDVTPSNHFYGPGGPYANFAGRDASRGLALGSFSEDILTTDLEGPLDSLEDLSATQLDTLRGWEEKFKDKYLVVGRLVAVSEH